jgi:hypothetical protein
LLRALCSVKQHFSSTMAATVEQIRAGVAALAKERAAGFTELTLRLIREDVAKRLGVATFKSKPEKLAVKAAVEAMLADPAAFVAGAGEGQGDSRRDSEGVFMQPQSPKAAVAPPVGAAQADAAVDDAPVAAAAVDAAASAYRCVKKAVLRESAGLQSTKVGTLQPGEVLAVLESCTVAGGTGPPLLRVRGAKGWTSVLSSSGNELLAPMELAEVASSVVVPTLASPAAEAGASPALSEDGSGTSSPPSGDGAKKRKRLSMSALVDSDEEEEEDEEETPIEPLEVEWVQCEEEGCGKWRRLPLTLQAADLPDRFVCSMNHWVPEQASCDAPEEAEHEQAAIGPEDADQEDVDEEGAEGEQESAGRRGNTRSSRNKSFGRLTKAQQKAVDALKTRETLKTLGDLNGDSESSDDEMEHRETEHMVRAKQAKRAAPAPADGESEDEEQQEAIEMEPGPSQGVAKKARKSAALLRETALFHDDIDGITEQKRLVMRKALPWSQRQVLEADELRLRKALASEEKKGDPVGKVARGLARLQVNAATADPILLAQAKRCVGAAGRRESLAAEATRHETKGELREALQLFLLRPTKSMWFGFLKLLLVLIYVWHTPWLEQVPVGDRGPRYDSEAWPGQASEGSGGKGLRDGWEGVSTRS